MAKAIKAKAKIDSQTIVSGDVRQAIHWYANWLGQQAVLGALSKPWVSSARGLFASNFEPDDQLLLETTLVNLEAQRIVPLVITGDDLYKQADYIWKLALQEAKFGQPAVSELEANINNCQLLVISNLSPPASAQQLWYLYHYVLYPRALAEKPVFISTPLGFEEFVMFGAGCDDFEYSGQRLTWEKIVTLLNATMLNLQQAKLLQAENLPVMLAPEYNLYRAVQESHLNIVPQQNTDQYVLDFAVVDPNARLKLNIECDFVHRFAKIGEPQRDAQLIKDGWQILHLSCKEITGSLDKCVALIEELGKGGSKKNIIGRYCNLSTLNYKINLPAGDRDQAKAIAHTGGPAVITGGAGTGKTTCASQRIAFLIGQGVSPERLLVISYSPETIQIIKSAANQLIAGPLIDRVNFYAWHDLGLRILKEHVSAIKRKLPLKVESQPAKIMQKLIAKYSKELDPTALELCGELDETTAANMISLYKANLVSAPMAKEQAGNEREQLLARVYLAYEEQMQKANKIDADDMITMAANMLGQEPDLRNLYQNLFEHVIVDEYQDATVSCDFLARLLAFPNDNLIFIGNEDESIFGHLGAAPQLLVETSIRAPETSAYMLSKNWRTHPQIAGHAEQFAQCLSRTATAKHHIEKTTTSGWSQSPAQAIIGPIQCPDESKEASWVADQIDLLKEQGRKLDEIAVICRTKEQMLGLNEIFSQRGLMVSSTNSELSLLPDESADVLSFLKLIADPDGPRAREYFEHVCQLRAKPIAPKLSTTILSWAESFNLSYLKAVEMYAEVAGDPDCVPFGQLIERIRDMHRNKMPPADIIHLLKMPQWLGNYYQSVKVPPGFVYEPLATMTEMEEKARIHKTVPDFLKSYSPPSNLLQQNAMSQPVLNLLSVAEVKGREFQIVFIPRLVDGILPDERMHNLEEERRVFYVCLTRARELLYLSLSHSPSPFLLEAGLSVTSSAMPSRSVQKPAAEDDLHVRTEPRLQPRSTQEEGSEIVEEFMEPQAKDTGSRGGDSSGREAYDAERAPLKPKHTYPPVVHPAPAQKLGTILQSKNAAQCSNCQVLIENDARFCGQCGAVQISAQRLCSTCGAPLEKKAKFCGECGRSN